MKAFGALAAGCVLWATAAHSQAGYRSEDCGRYMVQMEMNQCAERNFQAADDALNQLYRQVMDATRTPAARQSLIADERVWITERDARCAREAGPRETGGSIWPLEFATCQTRETNARIFFLQRQLARTSGRL